MDRNSLGYGEGLGPFKAVAVRVPRPVRPSTQPHSQPCPDCVTSIMTSTYLAFMSTFLYRYISCEHGQKT